jgi:hypothetical protein
MEDRDCGVLGEHLLEVYQRHFNRSFRAAFPETCVEASAHDDDPCDPVASWWNCALQWLEAHRRGQPIEPQCAESFDPQDPLRGRTNYAHLPDHCAFTPRSRAEPIVLDQDTLRDLASVLLAPWISRGITQADVCGARCIGTIAVPA